MLPVTPEACHLRGGSEAVVVAAEFDGSEEARGGAVEEGKTGTWRSGVCLTVFFTAFLIVFLTGIFC